MSSPLDESSRLVRAGEHPITQLVLGTAPWAGGVGAVLSHRAQERQHERLRTFLAALVADVRLLESRIADAPTDAELDATLARTQFALESVAADDDPAKVDFLRRFVVAGCLRDRPDATRTSLFRGYLQRLAGAHLVVLQHLYEVHGWLPQGDRLGHVRREGVLPVTVEAVATAVPQVADVLPLLLADLAGAGFVVDWQALGNQAPARREYVVADIGVDLLRYLKYEWHRPA